MAPNTMGTESILGAQWSPIGSKIGFWVKTVKNGVPLGPKFEFSITPRSSRFSQIMEVMGRNCPKTVILFSQKNMAPNHRGDPLGSILGPMGSHWVQKMGRNRKKIPCPKIRIFGHRFFANYGSYGYAPKPSNNSTP